MEGQDVTQLPRQSSFVVFVECALRKLWPVEHEVFKKRKCTYSGSGGWEHKWNTKRNTHFNTGTENGTQKGTLILTQAQK
jgi:hypothetical protein